MNRPLSVALVSLGCDKNLTDSERILASLEGGGFAITHEQGEADAIIVNTCGFIQSAVAEAEEALREAAGHKGGRCRAVVAVGCMARRYKDDLAGRLPGVDAVVMFEDYGRIAEVVYGLLGEEPPEAAHTKPRLHSTGHYAYLKIAEGCDNRCAYCTIPSIRGGYVSLPKAELLREAAALAAEGAKELIIVAQDTALYGRDLYGEPVLHELLRGLSEVEGVEALRLMYCYPEHITDELIGELAANDKICKYIDMPIQHADDSVLAAMGRRGDAASLRGVIAKLRGAVPGITIRTTLMVGFPGETEAAFKRLEAFVEEVKFGKLGVFAYSREEGTAAYDMAGQVPENVKHRREHRLMELQRRIARRNGRAYVGQTITARIDEELGDDMYIARGDMDAPEVDGLIYAKCERPLYEGEAVRVKITHNDDYDLSGVVVSE